MSKLLFYYDYSHNCFQYIFNLHAIECTGTASCKWTYSYLFKLDLANKVFALIPAVEMKIALMEVKTKSNDFHK